MVSPVFWVCGTIVQSSNKQRVLWSDPDYVVKVFVISGFEADKITRRQKLYTDHRVIIPKSLEFV